MPVHEHELEFESLPELEGEFKYEGEVQGEYEGEGEYEQAHEYEYEQEFESPMAQHEALAELMAFVASQAETESEAEAMAGASTVIVLSPRERRALRRLIPSLVRGAAILTRILRRRRATRPAVRVVPTIVRRTVRTLTRRVQSGQPVSRRTAGRIMAAQTQRVLGNPRVVTRAFYRNYRASRAAAVNRRMPRRRTAASRY
jgi:hypothetical protein